MSPSGRRVPGECVMRRILRVRPGAGRQSSGDVARRALPHRIHRGDPRNSRVHGVRHVGAILIPDGATPGCCPIVLEAKGVSPSFFPLQIPGGLTAPEVLGEDRSRYIYVAPGYRGEVYRFGNVSLLSVVVRSDAWGGATAVRISAWSCDVLAER